MSTNQQNSEQFIHAYEEIVKVLELKLYGKRKKQHTPFMRLVEMSIQKNDQLITRKYDFLKNCSQLRNFMQHNSRKEGLPLAIPRPDTVQQLEDILRQIKNPGKASTYMTKQPITVSPDTSLEVALDHIIRMDVSQIPVYEKNSYNGILTTNTITRWLAGSYKNEKVHIQKNVPVRNILDYREDFERADFITPNTNALYACAILRSDGAPTALLITSNGKPSGELRGILTHYDVKRIESRELP